MKAIGLKMHTILEANCEKGKIAIKTKQII